MKKVKKFDSNVVFRSRICFKFRINFVVWFLELCDFRLISLEFHLQLEIVTIEIPLLKKRSCNRYDFSDYSSRRYNSTSRSVEDQRWIGIIRTNVRKSHDAEEHLLGFPIKIRANFAAELVQLISILLMTMTVYASRRRWFNLLVSWFFDDAIYSTNDADSTDPISNVTMFVIRLDIRSVDEERWDMY